ncbi:hypothetical protein QYF61_019399 [Mycteria americana]|uniref:Uncharacterized protein n=1 Tax=Mycteria americana TaxID=33587 RepID=A0AAN7MN37_MYCAM|nr:hypothetical protein QYF61_019399 [Mycteria americana]
MTVFPAGLQRCAPATTKTSATGKNDPHATAVKGATGAAVDLDAMGAVVDLVATGTEDPDATGAVVDLDATGAVVDLDAMGAMVDLDAMGAVVDLDATGAVGHAAMDSHRIASSKFIKYPQR